MEELNLTAYVLNKLAILLDMATPAIVVIVPVIVALFKLKRVMKKLQNRLLFLVGKDFTQRLADWESNFSRQVIRDIGFFLDGIDTNPYCRADQIVYLALENGTVGLDRIHSMFISVRAETSSLSRCSKKISIQRLPYTAMAAWCAELEKDNILKIANLQDSAFSGLTIHETARSTIVVPVRTKERWLAGMIVFNYFDHDYNLHLEDTTKDEELLVFIKTYIEGHFIQMDLARQNWIKNQ